MLQSNLQRDGVNLSFSNFDLGNSTPTLYVDVGNNRVGINRANATVALDVVGTANISATVNANNVTATANVTAGNVLTSQVYSTSTFALYTSSNGNILLTPNGTGYTKAVGTNGFVVPTGTTSQRPAPGYVDVGTVRFNSQTLQLECWDGTNWQAATNGSAAITNQTITPDGSSVTYTLDSSTTAVAIIVTINGVLQTPDVAYTVLGNQITFAETPNVSDIIQVRYIALITAVSELSSSDGNTTVRIYNVPSIEFKVNDQILANLTTSNVFNISTAHSLQLPNYTVAQANALANVSDGQLIYVSNGDTGNPCLAVYSGGDWKRVALGATIST
jgi:hypothetical protein